MSTKDENVVYKRKPKSRIHWGRFVIFVILIAYIIMFVYTFFAQRIGDTVNIKYGVLEAKETVTGYITRNEHIVLSPEFYDCRVCS